MKAALNDPIFARFAPGAVEGTAPVSAPHALDKKIIILPTRMPTPGLITAVSKSDAPLRFISLPNKDGNLEQQLFIGATAAVQKDLPFCHVPRPTADLAGALMVPEKRMPPHAVGLSIGDERALLTHSYAQLLDTAALMRGESTHFESLLQRSLQAKKWECVWAALALDPIVGSQLAAASNGENPGLWLHGAWLSSAQLGALATMAAVKSAKEVEPVSEPVDVVRMLRMITEHLLSDSGKGLLFANRNSWSGQESVKPAYGVSLQQRQLNDRAHTCLLALAARDLGPQPMVWPKAAVAFHIGLKYGDGVSGDVSTAKKEGVENWTFYVVTDAMGRVLTAYDANDDRIKGMPGLLPAPSAPLPRALHAPDLAKRLDNTNAEWRFMKDVVLADGVPSYTRTAFENETRAYREGGQKPDATLIKQWQTQFAGVANAYMPEQWARAFGGLALCAKDFGARWQGAT